MKTPEASRALAESLVAIGLASGVRTEAFITRMDAPLGREVGNANEVIESIETLKGQGPSDLTELSVLLAARMLVIAGVAQDDADAETRIRGAIASGTGVEKFRQIIEHQGGDPRVIDDYARLPSTPDRAVVSRQKRSGYVASLEAESIGRAAVALGAGRGRLDDVIDHGVGITVMAPPGSGGTVRRSRDGSSPPRRSRSRDGARALLEQSVRLSEAPPSGAAARRRPRVWGHG